jgi:hypothetical protein
MRLIQLITGLALALGLLPLSGHAADTVSIQALLISASNRSGEADPRLAAYDSTLRRNLPLNTFRLSGEGAAAVAAGGKSSISLGRGHRLEIQNAKGGGSGIQLKVEWTHDKKTVISTTLTLQPGVPAVLGRRGDDDGEVPVVLLIAK